MKTKTQPKIDKHFSKVALCRTSHLSLYTGTNEYMIEYCRMDTAEELVEWVRHLGLKQNMFQCPAGQGFQNYLNILAPK